MTQARFFFDKETLNDSHTHRFAQLRLTFMNSPHQNLMQLLFYYKLIQNKVQNFV